MKNATHSLSAEIAVAIAGIDSENYWELIGTINEVLDKYGVNHHQRVKCDNVCHTCGQPALPDKPWCEKHAF